MAIEVAGIYVSNLVRKHRNRKPKSTWDDTYTDWDHWFGDTYSDINWSDSSGWQIAELNRQQRLSNLERVIIGLTVRKDRDDTYTDWDY